MFKQPKFVTIAGHQCTMDEVRATIALLKYYHAFLASEYQEAKHPTQWGFYMTKDEARRELSMLIDVAINRRAGIPDRVGRKQEPDYLIRLRRDRNALLDIHRRIRVYQFETKEIRQRFGHLLASREDH